MHIKNLVGYPRIAMIGMPRSGSTIMSSLINSVDGSFVVGEPHAMARAQRPPGMSHIPNILDTRYGAFRLETGTDVLGQLEAFGESAGARIIGFKECWVPVVEPLRLIKHYGDNLSHVLIAIREPRTNYMSIVEREHLGKMSPEEFTEKYVKLIEYVLLNNSVTYNKKAQPIVYELFIENPFEEVRRATGWIIEGDLELKMYAGGGDEKARTSTIVKDYNWREKYAGPELNRADRAYEILMETHRLPPEKWSTPV
jgi:hypothetical protein